MRLVLVDFRSQVYRALYTQGIPLNSSSGEPTRGTYFYTKILLKLLRQLKPTHALVAEESRHLIREKIYPEYKQNRSNRHAEPLEDLPITIKRCRQISTLLGLKFVSAPGYEADDVIATAATEWSRHGEVFIVSRDKDLHQLVNDRVVCYDPQDDITTKVDDVLKRWGVLPEKVLEMQTLMGDSTDNVPGIKGIGQKTAAKLINEYGTARDVLLNIEDLPERFQRAAQDFNYEVTRQLVALETQIPLGLSLADIIFHGPNLRAVAPLFDELGFRGQTLLSEKI